VATSRPTFTVEKLKKASNELHYEVWMLYEAARSIDSDPQPDRVSFNNALVESFCVHLRNLLDFFVSTPTKPDDLVALDFCSKGWTCPPWTIDLGDTRERLNKRLSHLTHRRVDYVGEDRKWDLKALVNAFDAPLAELGRQGDRGHPGTLWETAPLTNPFQSTRGPSGSPDQKYLGDTGPTGPASPGIPTKPGGGKGPTGPAGR